MKTWNEFTGITTKKRIYKLLHNGGTDDKYSIKRTLTMLFFLVWTIKGRKVKT